MLGSYIKNRLNPAFFLIISNKANNRDAFCASNCFAKKILWAAIHNNNIRVDFLK